MTRRTHGTGSVWIEDRANGRKVWMGQARVAGKQYQRLLGDVRRQGAKDGLTRAMAERALREVRATLEDEAQQEDGPQGPRGDATLSQVADAHFAYLETVMGRKARTVEDYRSMLRVHLIPFFADCEVSAITKADVERFMAHTVTERKRSHGTMLNLMNLLHAILQQALRDDLIDSNPVAKARRPRSPGGNKKIRFLSPEEVQALVRAAPDDDLGRMERVLYLTAAWTGLRQGELLACQGRLKVDPLAPVEN